MLEKLKNSWKSVTIWFNGIATTVLVALPMLQDSLPSLQPYTGPRFYKGVMFAVIAGNIALRFKTNKGLEKK